MSKNYELMLRLKAENQASKSLKEVQSDLEKLEQKKKELEKVLSGEKTKIKISPEEAIKELQKVEKEFEKLQEIADRELGAKAFSQAQQEADAYIRNMETISDKLQGFSEGVRSIAGNIIGTASQMENLNTRILGWAKGNKELAADMSSFFEEFNKKTPFQLPELEDVGLRMEKYGISVKEHLKDVGDFAADNLKDLGSTMEAIADVQTGEFTRMKENFGITKEFLAKKAQELYGETIVNAQGTVTNLKVLNDTLFTYIRETSGGAMERMSETYTGAISNLEDAVTSFKASIGKEILPTITDLIKNLTSVVNWMNSFSEGTKNIAGNFLLFGGSMTVAVAGIFQAGLQIRTLVTALEAASTAAGTTRAGFMSLTASVTTVAPWAALAVVVGTVGNAFLDAWYKAEKFKSDKIDAETDKMAKGFKALREAIKEVNNTPLDIAFKKSPEELKSEIEGIDEVLNVYKQKMSEKQSDQSFTYKFSETKSASAGVSDFAGQQMEMKAPDARQYLSRHIEEDEKSLEATQKGTQAYLDLKASINDAETALSALDLQLKQSDPAMSKQIDNAEKYKLKLLEASSEEYQFAASIRETVSGFDDYIPALDQTSESWKKYIDSQKQYHISKTELLEIDKEVVKAEQMAGEKQKEALQKIMEEHKNYGELKVNVEKKFTDEQGKEILKQLDNESKANKWKVSEKKEALEAMLKDERFSADTIAKIKEDLAKVDDKSTKENLKKQKDDWDNFIKGLKISLKDGEVSQKQYLDAIKAYETEHGITSKTNHDLWLQIDKEYSDEAAKIRTEDKKNKEKDDKEELQRIKEQAEMRRQLLTSLAELTPDKFDDIEAWRDAQKIALEQQKAEYEKHNVDKNEIDKWYYTSLEALGIESKQKKKDLETEELQRQISNKEKLLELSRREAESPGATSIFGDLQKQKQYLEEMYALQQQMVSAIAQEGEPLLLRVSSGQKLNDVEQKTYDLYVNQLGKLDEIGDKILENANQELLAYNKRKQAMLSYIQTAIMTGKMSASEGSNMLQGFIDNATGQMRAHIDSVMETIDGDISKLTEADLQMFDVFNTALDDTIKTTGRLPQEFQNTNNAIKTGNQYIDEMTEKINNTASSATKISSSMDNVTSGIGKATSATQGFSNSLSQAADKASELADKMQTIGSITASSGGTTPSGLGGFSSEPGGLGQRDNPSPSEMSGDAQAAKDKMYGSGNNTMTSGGLTTGDQDQLGAVRGYTEHETGVKGSLTASQALEKIQGQYVLDAKTLGQEQAYKNYASSYDLYVQKYYKKQSQNSGQFLGWNSSADVSGYTPFGYGGQTQTFDNPVNDKMAFSLGQKKADAIVNRSEEDLAYFYTAGMVERIKDKVSMAGKPDTVNMSSPVSNNISNNNQKSTIISPTIYVNGNQVETTPELKRASINITETALKFSGFKGFIT